MAEIKVGETVYVKGSAKDPYALTNHGSGGLSCSCPAWRNQSTPVDKRTCKHLRKYLGDESEAKRCNLENLSLIKALDKVVPPVMLALEWDFEDELIDWWVSEKLDGVRGWWDGNNFVSREGNIFKAPDFFKRGLPSKPLDGELWMGRGMFQATSGLCRSGGRDDEWEKMRYRVFDAPSLEPFEARQKNAKILIKKAPYAEIVRQEKCKGAEHLKQLLVFMESLGAEGLIVRAPKSAYDFGSRSGLMLKVKSFAEDDAIVTGHEKGKGKYKGKTGSLKVRWNDTDFELGSGLKDRERKTPPPIGTKVIFWYRGFTDSGKPKHATYKGVRAD